MGTHETPPVGYHFCLMQQCMGCSGTGWLKPSFCAANDMQGLFWQNTVEGSGAVPPPTKCPDCINGFRFVALRLQALLPWLLKELGTNPGGLQQELLDVIVTASEGRMIGEKKA